MLNAAVILQARMASLRLPGKALARIGGRTILAHCLSRLQSGSPVPVVLATTNRADDDQLADEAARLGVETFRGPAEDVLARFALAARALRLDYVVRATADNPAVDIDATRRVLRLLTEAGVDHVCESALPYGTAVEAMTADALLRADAIAVEPSDREHVTTLIRRDRACFHAVEPSAPVALRRPELRLTVDTAADLEYMRRLFAAAGHPMVDPPLATLIAAADSLVSMTVNQ
jgi:spore coat polysaccharide biosynthesis protein SpsF (cytidylyltransferase family)